MDKQKRESDPIYQAAIAAMKGAPLPALEQVAAGIAAGVAEGLRLKGPSPAEINDQARGVWAAINKK